MDTLEDTTDRRLEYEWPKLVSRWEVQDGTEREAFPCKMLGCGHRLASQSALDAHLFAEHAEAGFYLAINEQVAHPRMLLTEPCRRLEIRTLGRDPIDLELVLPDGQRFRATILQDRVDVLADLDLGAIEHGTIIVTGSTGPSMQRYEVSVLRAMPVDYEAVDSLVLCAQRGLPSGGASDWEELSRQAHRRSGRESQYLRGFAEYLLGCDQENEARGHDAGARFQEAFGLLHGFGTDLALSARVAIAFKLNAFQVILDSAPRSQLAMAARFFGSPEPTELQVAETPRLSTGRGIWLDEVSEGVLHAVSSYAQGQFEEVDEEIRRLRVEYRRQLTSPPGTRLLPSETKLRILEGRVAGKRGDLQRRREAFGLLLWDPRYCDEAEVACR